MLCLDTLQQGYDRMVSDGQYDVDWEEDNLTVHLIEKIEQTDFLKSYRIEINPQRPIYNKSHIYEGESPKKAPVVDFKMSKWFGGDLKHFYAEAKNLSASDWQKKDGSKVNASKYRARYIETGIENFLSGRYPEGCLLGYVVNGASEKVIERINRLIESRGLTPRVGPICKSYDHQFSILFHSKHIIGEDVSSIKHLMMQFYKTE